MAIKAQDLNSVIGDGTTFRGNFKLSGSIEVHGAFEGEISAEEHVHIAETGKMKTNIKAKKVSVSGLLIGNIKAEEEVNVSASGKVKGDITTPILNLQKGAVTVGKVNIVGEAEPEIEDPFLLEDKKK